MRTPSLASLCLPIVFAVACGGSEFDSGGGTAGAGGASGAAAGGASGAAGTSAGGGGGAGGAAGAAGSSAGGAGGAGGAPLDIAGEYSVTTTNGADTCGSAMWMEGAVNKDIPFTITQKGVDLTAVVGGWAGLGQNLLLGNNAPLLGTVSGNDFTLKAVGDVKKDKTCESFWTATATGKSSADTISGKYVFSRAITKNTADCAAGMVTECTQTFTFAGVRPPKGL